ncbi:MAG: hypothetical protein FH751_10005 [Firmicutes bacterium]|nr:hypothetical protein [Bacillota bacterium]
MKKKLILGTILIIIIVLVYGYFNFYSKPIEGFEITVKNLTDRRIDGLFLTCAGIKKDIKVETLKPDEKKVVLVQPKNYGENSISLCYLDNDGKEKKHIVVGYFEESYGNGYAVVKIDNVLENGILDISSKYKFSSILWSNR